MGVMAGTLDLIQRGYLGSTFRDGELYFDPKLTDKLEGLSFSMRFRDTPLSVNLEAGKLKVSVEHGGGGGAIKIGVGEDVQTIEPGEAHDFDRSSATASTT